MGNMVAKCAPRIWVKHSVVVQQRSRITQFLHDVIGVSIID